MEDIPSPSSGTENSGTMGYVHYYLSTAYQLLYGAVKQESAAVKQESAAVPPEESANQQPQARKTVMIGCCGVEFCQLLCSCSLS